MTKQTNCEFTELQKSLDDWVKVAITMKSLLYELSLLNNPQIQELFDKYEIKITVQPDG